MGTSSRSSRWWPRSWWSRERGPSALDPTREDLVVVASSFDDAEAASAALVRAAGSEPRWRPDDQAVLRHHLLLPAGQLADAVAVAGQDGYAEVVDPSTGTDGEQDESNPAEPTDPGGAAGPDDLGHPASVQVPDGRALRLQRVQTLDALTLSQERSRMAGLAQRRDGVALGWEALQPRDAGGP